MATIETVPRLFPPIGWFMTAASYPVICVNLSRRWNKREKWTHRYSIADTHGPIDLTVPVSMDPTTRGRTYADVRLSRHGNWWHVHRVTLESAYGRTPFFEHYFPLIAKFFDEETVDHYPFLWEYELSTLNVMMDLFKLDTQVVPLKSVPDGEITVAIDSVETSLPEYWQVRADKFGFIGGLSALDLLFNMGPEAALYFRRQLHR